MAVGCTQALDTEGTEQMTLSEICTEMKKLLCRGVEVEIQRVRTGRP